MINNPEINIIFTDEQKEAIEAAKSRLLNLESEIIIANKNIKVCKGELEKVTKERMYQEELLANAETSLTSILQNSKVASQELETKKEELALVNSSIATQKEAQQSKEIELTERENTVKIQEAKLNASLADVTKSKEELDNDRIAFNIKVAQVKEVIKDF